VAQTSEPTRLIDTDILVDALRGITDAVDFLASLQADTALQISVISAMELIAGCRNARELSQLRQFLQQIKVLPIDANISWRAHELMNSFFLSHGLLIPDALIAATALELGLTLCTKNIRHFQMIEGLEVSRPY
jgi:predicted nucleic acid-binding protein